MKFLATACILPLLFSLSAAAPADTGVIIAKVGDKPDVELVSKRSFDVELEKRDPEPQRLDWRTTSKTAAARVPFNKRTHTTTFTTTTTTSERATRPSAGTTTTTPRATTTSSRAPTTAPAVSATGTASATQSSAITTTSSAPVSGSTFGANIRDSALNEHNRFRALHGANALVWDQPLADAAGTWAKNCKFQHSQGAVGPYGENLAANAGTAPQGGVANITTKLIGLWEAEAPDYNATDPKYSHFTQMVWKSTTKLGCALQKCAPGTIFDAAYGKANYLVCEYNPAGNVYPAANFRANVQP
ncbi:hypothetical protein JCM11641_003543 [Rhodosporidiobolus odoratus]